MKALALKDQSILVCRPAPQGLQLCESIEQLGGKSHFLPTILLQETLDDSSQLMGAEIFPKADILLFISPNAARLALRWIKAKGLSWPQNALIGAIGQATQRVLQKQGLVVHISPAAKFDSEHLLALLKNYPLTHKQIIIFRGQGGRELLGKRLMAQGAELTYVELYRRVCPVLSKTEQGLLRSTWSQIQWIVCTSCEGLINLCRISKSAGIAGIKELQDKNLLLVSQRMIKLAHRLKFPRLPLLAHSASNRALLAALCKQLET